jgi:hypothetical protein
MSASHRDDTDGLIDDMDRVIDDVAREMTGVAPRPDFAARVAARVAGADTAGARHGRPFSSPSPWLLAPAAAVLLLAVFIVRETRGPAEHVARVGLGAPAAPLQPAPDDAPPAVRPSTPAATAATAATRRTAPRPARPAATLPDPDLPSLIVAPMAVDRLSVSPLARGDAIEISAIAIERIDIVAMP